MNFRYRYIDRVDEEGVRLDLELYAEVRRTPCGAWVKRYYHGGAYGKERFVLDGRGRRYCHQTKEFAWESYRERKKNQLRIAKDSLAKAEYALEQAAILGAPPEESLILGKPDYWHQYIFD